MYTNAIRISHKWFASKGGAKFSVKETDAIIDRFCDGDYIPLQDVKEFALFPESSFPWTEYLLEQYVAFYSEKFYLMLRDDASYRAIVDALVDFSDDAYVRHTEAVKRIATAYLKLLFPNVRTASDVNPKEFMKYCLRPAIKMRKIIWRQLSILDAEYKNDDKLMPEFTLKEISNEA